MCFPHFTLYALLQVIAHLLQLSLGAFEQRQYQYRAELSLWSERNRYRALCKRLLSWTGIDFEALQRREIAKRRKKDGEERDGEGKREGKKRPKRAKSEEKEESERGGRRKSVSMLSRKDLEKVLAPPSSSRSTSPLSKRESANESDREKGRKRDGGTESVNKTEEDQTKQITYFVLYEKDERVFPPFCPTFREVAESVMTRPVVQKLWEATLERKGVRLYSKLKV